ncbi:adiponectin receptor 1b [Micractinium conductrix]|uniref:Adiponectin receptor 1b n=1 Tax=Micractinium conductrix TaxID=554055 RepID=A0A2P6VJ75_9CHLO|nr:adiponectin receptor 1b [Micractinium conductrix]|eukprot:PSC74139.1 adiponectin receptor 1b [Micractinium conductrix]
MALTRSAIKRHKQGDGADAYHRHQHPHASVSHWRDLHDPATGRLKACRPPGAPAGTFPHTPWWHCVCHDPYERINFWSHAVPGVALLALATLATGGRVPGGGALAAFCCCAAATHLCSALTHIWPDSHSLEKADHLGIVLTIVGTPITALMAQEHGHVPTGMVWVTIALVIAACLPPVPRVTGFVGGGAAAVLLYWRQLACVAIGVELALYLAGAIAFLRNGGHDRWTGLTDHHFLHYNVTLAASLHVWHLMGNAAAAEVVVAAAAGEL